LLYPFFFLVTLACSSKAPAEQKLKESKQMEEKGTYHCPMKCTEEMYNKPGKCKICNMDLEKVSPS
jgi:hypothetical protein